MKFCFPPLSVKAGFLSKLRSDGMRIVGWVVGGILDMFCVVASRSETDVKWVMFENVPVLQDVRRASGRGRIYIYMRIRVYKWN